MVDVASSDQLDYDDKRGGPIEIEQSTVEDHEAVYPYNKVTKFDSGHTLEFNNTPNNEYVRIKHKVGSEIIMTKDGDILIKHSGEREDKIGGHHNVTIGGSTTINVAGDYNLNVGGNMNWNIRGRVDWNLSDDIQMNTFFDHPEINANENASLNAGRMGSTIEPQDDDPTFGPTG